jgi:hypothetical protein
MRAEAHAHIKWLVKVQIDGWAKLVHGFALQADEDRDGIAMLFDSDALRFDPGEGAPEAVLHVLDERPFVRTPRQVDHAHPVLADHGFFGVVVEILPNHQDYFAIAIAVRVREGDVGCELNIAGHFLPQETKLIARVPDVVTGGVDGVLPGRRIISGTPRHNRAADIRLAPKDADRRIEIRAWPMEICRWRDLDMRR